ncbi:MAG: hypothetical protein AAF561_08270 [Planctomycetota bacterium]
MMVAGTFVLRLGEAVIAAVPDLLVGVLLAGVLRHVVGDVRLQRWFAKPWTTALTAIAWPVGAAGILPIAVVLHRAGVRPAAVVATLFVGGAVGPLSIAYLMERASPLAALVLVAMLFAIAVLLFAVVARVEGPTTVTGDDAPGFPPALGEARPLLRATWLPLLIGIFVFAGVASFLPGSFVGYVMVEPSAVHAVSGVGMPLVSFYPQNVAALFSGEAAAGVYRGAALVMLVGGGVTVGSAILLFMLVGRKVATVSLATGIVLVLIAFFALQFAPPLVPPIDEDSHAFDRLSQPHKLLVGDAGFVESILMLWGRALSVGKIVAAGVLVLLIVLPRMTSPRSKLAPAWMLRTLGIVGVVTWVGLTLYVYFPAPAVALVQMRHPEGDLSSALGQGDVEQAHVALDRIDRLATRGRTGALLRLDTSAADELAAVNEAVASTRTSLPPTPEYRDAVDVFVAARDARN